jgi:hypothetical protein
LWIYLLDRGFGKLSPVQRPWIHILIAAAEKPVPEQSTRKVNWQSISALPLISSMIDGLLDEVEQQYRNLQSCRLQPHVLDDYTVGRVIKVYTDQADDVGQYAAQLSRWNHLNLTSSQRQEVDRLSKQISRIRERISAFLALAAELSHESRCKVVSPAPENVETKRQCGSAEVFVESGKRYPAPVRQFKIGGVVQRKPETIGELECFRPSMRICLVIRRNFQHGQVVERGPPKLRIDAASSDGNGETVGYFQAPERRHKCTRISYSMEKLAHAFGNFVTVDPSKRRRAIEHQAHGRPSSR